MTIEERVDGLKQMVGSTPDILDRLARVYRDIDEVKEAQAALTPRFSRLERRLAGMDAKMDIILSKLR